MARGSRSAAASSSSAAAAGAPEPSSSSSTSSALDTHLQALADVAEAAGVMREGMDKTTREDATEAVAEVFKAVDAAYRFLAAAATPEARAADPDLAVRARDGAKRHAVLAESVGELLVARAAERALAAAEKQKKPPAAVLAAVQAALRGMGGGEGTAAAAAALQERLAESGSSAAAVAALKAEVAFGKPAGEWAMAVGCTYRPFEALALLEEMAAWLRPAIQHCGLRDTVQKLEARAAPLRDARADDYAKGYRHANALRAMLKSLSEEGRVAPRAYKKAHAALLFADLKYQSHFVAEAVAKELLATLTAKPNATAGRGSARTTAGADDDDAAKPLVEFLPVLHRERVAALVAAAEGKGSKGGGKPAKRGQAPQGSGKGKQAAPKEVAIKPLVAQILGYTPPPGVTGGAQEKGAGRRPQENPFRTVLEVVDGVVAKLAKACKGGQAAGLKKRKAPGGGADGDFEDPYTVKRGKAQNSEQRQRRRWGADETRRLLRGLVKFWDAGVRWRRIKEWDGQKGDRALLMHRTNLDLNEKARSLLERWEREEGVAVDKDAYPAWAEALYKDRERLEGYCASAKGAGAAAAAAEAEAEEED